MWNFLKGYFTILFGPLLWLKDVFSFLTIRSLFHDIWRIVVSGDLWSKVKNYDYTDRNLQQFYHFCVNLGIQTREQLQSYRRAYSMQRYLFGFVGAIAALGFIMSGRNIVVGLFTAVAFDYVSLGTVFTSMFIVLLSLFMIMHRTWLVRMIDEQTYVPFGYWMTSNNTLTEQRKTLESKSNVSVKPLPDNGNPRGLQP